jgi:hypothetical protein
MISLGHQHPKRKVQAEIDEASPCGRIATNEGLSVRVIQACLNFGKTWVGSDQHKVASRLSVVEAG